MHMAGFHQPCLILPLFLNCTENIFHVFGASGVEHASLDIQAPFVADVQAFTQDALGLEDSRLLAGQDVHTGLVFRVVEQVAVEEPLESFEIIFHILVSAVSLGVRQVVFFGPPVDQPPLALRLEPIYNFGPLGRPESEH